MEFPVPQLAFGMVQPGAYGMQGTNELQLLLLRTATWTVLLRARASHRLPS